MKSARTVAVFAALAIGPLYFTLAGSFAGPEGSTHQLTYDTYGYFYPNILHASRSFLEGAGLFWNPYQNCGQPFFAFSLTGLLYPVNFVFFLLERDSALLASAAMNLVLGGLGTWLLLREYRLSVPASLCGALAFQLSAPVLELGSWSPMHSGAIVWMPWAMFCLERILRRPSIHHGIALAVVLAVQTLPGFPQIPLFTLQLMALRLVWAVLGGQVPEWRPLAVPLLIGFGSVPFLVAAQYLPALEVAAESVRASGVDPGSVTLEGFPVGYFPGVLAAMLAAAGWVMRRNRALIAFYLVAAVIFLLLSRGPDNFLFELYADMPLGDLFIRRPKRFLWVSNFAFAVLVAFGVDSLRDASESWRLKLTSLAAMLGCLIALNAVMPSGLATSAWLIGGLALAVVAYGHSRLPGRTLTPWLMIVGLGVTSLWATSILVPREPDLYDRHAGLLEPLSHRLTAQDRVFLSARSLDFPFIEKLSSIYVIPGVTDYEPQTTRRFAEYTTQMIRGFPMTRLNHFLRLPYLNRKSSLALLDLSAARYVVLPESEPGQKGWKEVDRDEKLVVYENARALPRAFFVSRVRVVEEDRTLKLLRRRAQDPRDVALVETAPASGFLGEAGATGTVEFLRNSPERVELSVIADGAGFVHLTDQYFPGWSAELNGTPVEIMRANHVFRLVQVPKGTSTLVFIYRPSLAYAGAGLSVTTFAVLLWLWFRTPREA